MNHPTRTVYVRVPEPVAKALEQRAAAEGRSLSNLIRLLLQRVVDTKHVTG